MSMYTADDPGYTTLLTYDKADLSLDDERIWADTGNENLATSLYVDSSYVYMVGKSATTANGDYDAILIKVAKPL